MYLVSEGNRFMKIVSTFSRRCFELAGVSTQQIEEMDFVTYPTADFFSALSEAQYLFTSSLYDISKEVIEAGPRLKLIQTMGVGFNKIDRDWRQSVIFLCATIRRATAPPWRNTRSV
jgi:lactate dehydrogenase-like 2-hydroxyacid dehydrogenase